MAERSKAAVLKTVKGLRPSRVRIPASPTTLTEVDPVIRVLIVDDHDIVRTGIRRLLDDVEGIRVVGEAKSGEAAVQYVRKNSLDLALLDVNMPGMGGLEATRRIVRINPDLKIIALTALNGDPYPSMILQAGASGYLTKETSMEDMVDAIKKVFAGQRYISSDIAQQMALRSLGDVLDETTPFEALSERELQVMTMITKGNTVQEISERLCLSSKTVNSYRYRLFDKLKIKNDVELTLLALRHNMIEQVDIAEASGAEE